MQKKEITEISITGVLILILIFAIFSGIKGRANKKQIAKMPPLQQNVTPAAQNIRQEPLSAILKKESQNLQLKRDPFGAAPIVTIKRNDQGIALTGISWDKNNPTAIIDNEIVSVGDKVGGNTVVDIKEDRVILSDGSRNLEIRLGQ